MNLWTYEQVVFVVRPLRFLIHDYLFKYFCLDLLLPKENLFSFAFSFKLREHLFEFAITKMDFHFVLSLFKVFMNQCLLVKIFRYNLHYK